MKWSLASVAVVSRADLSSSQSPAPSNGTAYPVCANGMDDWARDVQRRPCSAGCSNQICTHKVGHEGLCYTQAQVNAGDMDTPRGCNYGSPENTCAFDANNQCVYASSSKRKDPVKVIISYTPAGHGALAVSSQLTEECEIAQYQLVLENSGLQLVAVKKAEDGKGQLAGYDPCVEGTTLNYWQIATDAAFWPEKGEKSCLTTDGITLMTTDKSLPCTNTNNWDQGWFFSQELDDQGNPRFCMPAIPQADSGSPQVLSPDLRVILTGHGECSSSWERKIFDPTVTLSSDLQQQTTLHEKTCPACMDSIGNYACLLDDCFLAPSKSFCEGMGGEWCSPPPPSYPECADGADDWARQSERRPCSEGCSFETCENKIGKDAVEHCYTKAQVGKAVIPHGCNYGSAENTCAYDDNGQCVYSDLGSLLTV